jgi:hypothetical protein
MAIHYKISCSPSTRFSLVTVFHSSSFAAIISQRCDGFRGVYVHSVRHAWVEEVRNLAASDEAAYASKGRSILLR